MARSGKAQKQLSSKIRSERILKKFRDAALIKSELIEVSADEDTQTIEGKKTKKTKE
jgi:hypothetical protein